MLPNLTYLGLTGYKNNLNVAGESDARLDQRLQQHLPAFRALSLDAAISQMPRLQVHSCSAL